MANKLTLGGNDASNTQRQVGCYDKLNAIFIKRPLDYF